MTSIGHDEGYSDQSGSPDDAADKPSLSAGAVPFMPFQLGGPELFGGFGESRATPNRTFGAAKGIGVQLRLDDPVHGVQARPHLFVRYNGELAPADSVPLRYDWQRSRKVWPCAYLHCPTDRTLLAKRPNKGLQCVHCVRTGVPLACGRFCSLACFRNAWPSHVLQCHHGPPPRPHDSKADEDVDSDEDEDVILRTMSRSAREASNESTDDDSWISIGNTKTYTPGLADIGHRLRLVVSLDAMDGSGTFSDHSETSWVVFQAPHARPRPLMPSPSGLPSGSDPNTCFRVMSYNVLAEIYANGKMYPYCPLWALSWDYRKHRVLEELKSYDGDILCLQEVQHDHYMEFLQSALAGLGYTGIYKAKTREPMGMQGKVDGCALFFRQSRFKALEKYVIEFNEAASATHKNSRRGKTTTADQHQATLKRLMRDNVAQVVVLQMTHGRDGRPLDPPPVVCVSNTHLFWDPEFADVKLWQTDMLVKELERFFMRSRQMPLIICGDFNSEPDSAVHKLLSCNAPGRRSGGLTAEDMPKDPHHILANIKPSHTLPLQSCVAAVTGREAPFTNYTKDFVGTLDYVWITTHHLAVTSMLEIPSAEVLEEYAGTPLPNSQWPSDHVAMVFDLALLTGNGPAGAAGAGYS